MELAEISTLLALKEAEVVTGEAALLAPEMGTEKTFVVETMFGPLALDERKIEVIEEIPTETVDTGPGANEKDSPGENTFEMEVDRLENAELCS